MAQVAVDSMQSSKKIESSISTFPSNVPLLSIGAPSESVNPLVDDSTSSSTSSSNATKASNPGSADSSGRFSTSGISKWARALRRSASLGGETVRSEEPTKSAFSLITSGFTKRASNIPIIDTSIENRSESHEPKEGGLGTLTKGFLDTSRNAMKAVQLKARHLVSQNKRRYQEGGFDLDMTYITDNVIAMGFPAGDISSGLLGYVEGFYRNHMEEVIMFFETRHQGKYKVYNLCSERLYDAALFEGKVACFPFDDHNCPPLPSVMAFCRSAYAWLKGDLENVVVVHCKAGMARTGLMICSLLLYLKFFPTAEESIAYFNQKRCTDGKALVLPSQVRYVKYFERVLRDFHGNTPSGKRCILRGIRLHKCPYWVRPSITILDHVGVLFSTKKHSRTKELMPENFWFNAPRKGVIVFALPGERCIASLNGDFKVLFQDRHGDFYCWLNTNMMNSREYLGTSELEGFDKRRLPSPGLQVEIVVLEEAPPTSVEQATPVTTANEIGAANLGGPQKQVSQNVEVQGATANPEKDDIFSDSEDEDSRNFKDGSQLDKSKSDKVASSEFKLDKVMSSPKFDQTTIGLRPDAESSASTCGAPETISRGQEHEASLASLKPPETVARSGNPDQVEEQSSFLAHSSQIHGETLALESALEPNRNCESLTESTEVQKIPLPSSDFKAIAAASSADASVFTFGDDEDYDTDDE